MKMGFFEWVIGFLVIVILGVFIYSGFANAARGKASYALAMEALKTDEARPERFYGIDEPGFADFLRMIERRAKRMFSYDGQVRGITNAKGLVFIAFEDGHFAIVRQMETIQTWVNEESGRVWIIF